MIKVLANLSLLESVVPYWTYTLPSTNESTAASIRFIRYESTGI